MTFIPFNSLNAMFDVDADLALSFFICPCDALSVRAPFAIESDEQCRNVCKENIEIMWNESHRDAAYDLFLLSFGMFALLSFASAQCGKGTRSNRKSGPTKMAN